jgi:hypothetical protein
VFDDSRGELVSTAEFGPRLNLKNVKFDPAMWDHNEKSRNDSENEKILKHT